MKSFLATSAIILIVTNAFAAEDSTANFGKQSFLPAGGEFYVDGSLEILSAKTKMKASGLTVADTKIDSTSFNYLLGYGIMDRLSVGVSGSYY
jgi:hypothetical protein